MDDIDYTPFLYHKTSPEKSRTSKEKRSDEKPPKHGRGKTVFVVVLAFLLCFGILFFSVDFFANGKILKKIYASFVKNEYEYYMVAVAYPTRETAQAGVLLSESNGGAGYLLSDENGFTVLSGVYTDKAGAQKVVDKNHGSYLYTLRYATSSTELGNLTDDFIRETETVVSNLDVGTFSDATLSSHVNRYLILFSAYETENEQEAEYVSFLTSCLQSLDPGTTERTTLLFQIRHLMCVAVFSAKAVFS